MRRGKVKIKPITNAKARHVCFSKRHQVVIKKANELSILCGVNVAVAVFSPVGKPFFFGCPTAQAVTRCLLGMGPSNPTMGDERNDSGDEIRILQELNLKYQQLQQENEVEKKKNRLSQQAVNNEHGEHLMLQWPASDLNVLGLNELEAFGTKLNIIDDTINSYHVVLSSREGSTNSDA
ncbi:hypothetical protein E2562_024169 [Oryza meyeriana var. granulata]|uniref:MADS-box domain-containing protein n=1 Tax=Oryza meyeriana var. granulata TaxID=110450 RepID=A0A6G1CGN8_9ORYZ|nr:hypothetical protein E2562_024169 [Oryza meyeriana var. granulata]